METRYQRVAREQSERQAARAERERIRLAKRPRRARKMRDDRFRYADGTLSTAGNDARHGEPTDDLGESEDF